MAVLYPFSNETVRFLSVAPSEGETHLWLAQAAGRLRQAMRQELCIQFLRKCCDQLVRHRQIPDKEIEAAVAFAYGGTYTTGSTGATGYQPKTNYGQRALNWPDVCEETVGRVIVDCDPLFDGVTDTGLGPVDILPSLFEAGELICTGRICEKAVIRPLEVVLLDAAEQQFIVVNPMKGPHALNQQGKISPRCQNNIKERRHLVAEFDDPTLPKEGQAVLASQLGKYAPLVLAVDSGGKSVHAWYRVDALTPQEQARFFAHACTLGADRTRWDTCGWLRMPGGMRVKGAAPPVRQRILYWNGQCGMPDAKA